MKLLLECGADVNASRGSTALHAAASGRQPGSYGVAERATLHYAIEAGNVNIQLILTYRADPNIRSLSGITPLIM